MATPPLPAGFAIRDASIDDLSVVLHHRAEMFRDMGFGNDTAIATAIELSRPFFAQGLRDGTYRGWLVVDGNGTVAAGGGVVLLHYHPSPRDLSDRRPVAVNVFTERPYRRLGLARHIMLTMIAWARSRRFTSLYLHASEDGRALYDDLGFVRTNEMRLALEP